MLLLKKTFLALLLSLGATQAQATPLNSAGSVALAYGQELAEIARSPISETETFERLCRMLAASVDIDAMREKTLDNIVGYGVEPWMLPDGLYLAAVATFIMQHTMSEQREYAAYLDPYVSIQGRNYGVIYMRREGTDAPDPTAIFVRNGKIYEIRGGKSGEAARALQAYSFAANLGNAIEQDSELCTQFGRNDDCWGEPAGKIRDGIEGRIRRYFDRRTARRYRRGCPL